MVGSNTRGPTTNGITASMFGGEMDGQGFDRLTRALAARMGRRSSMRIILGALASGTLWTRGTRPLISLAVEAQEVQVCTLSLWRGDRVSEGCESVRADAGFHGALDRINQCAKNAGVSLCPTDSWRRVGTKIVNGVVQQAERTNHQAGHAIDLNIYYCVDPKDSKRYIDCVTPGATRKLCSTSSCISPNRFRPRFGPGTPLRNRFATAASRKAGLESLVPPARAFFTCVDGGGQRDWKKGVLRWGMYFNDGVKVRADGTRYVSGVDPVHIDDGINTYDLKAFDAAVKSTQCPKCHECRDGFCQPCIACQRCNGEGNCVGGCSQQEACCDDTKTCGPLDNPCGLSRTITARLVYTSTVDETDANNWHHAYTWTKVMEITAEADLSGVISGTATFQADVSGTMTSPEGCTAGAIDSQSAESLTVIGKLKDNHFRLHVSGIIFWDHVTFSARDCSSTPKDQNTSLWTALPEGVEDLFEGELTDGRYEATADGISNTNGLEKHWTATFSVEVE